MQATQGSLVIVGANTTEMQVFWNGTKIDNVKGLNLVNNELTTNVVLTIAEDAEVSEMTAAGIKVKRV